MSIALILIALALLCWLAYKGLPMIIASIICGVFVLLTASMNLYDGTMGSFMKGFGDYLGRYFLMFLLGALFGKVVEISGATDSIASAIVNKLGEKYVVTSITLAAIILGFGGVSVFVAFFALYPLAMSMFKKADIPRKLFPGSYCAGAGTVAMTSAFSPSIQNIMPTTYFGTDATAAALPNMISAVFVVIAVVWYMLHQVKRCKARGEHFDDTGTAIAHHDADKATPHLVVALLPMAALLVALNVLRFPVEGALFIGIATGLIVYFKYIPKTQEAMLKHMGTAIGAASNSIVNTAAVVGFGAIVASTPAFQQIIKGVTSMDGNPLIIAGIATTALAGVAGSSSGGLALAIPIIGQYFLPLGVNPEALHRVCTVASGGLDSLPNSGFIATILNYTENSYKDAYMHIFICTGLIPLVQLAVLFPLLKLFGYM